MSRAEEAIKSQKVKDAANDYCSAYYDWHNEAERRAVTSTFKQGYFEGYEQAEKDTIERACEWMEKNIRLPHPRKGTDECIVNLNAFRKAMEERK